MAKTLYDILLNKYIFIICLPIFTRKLQENEILIIFCIFLKFVVLKIL